MPNAEITLVRAFLASTDGPKTIPEMREMYNGMGSQFPTQADVVLRPADIDGVPGEWASTPGAATDRVIMYVHGGGYVIGSIASHRHLVTELGRAAGAQTLSLDYRLAPENPFPAAVDDAFTGYRHLLAQGFAHGKIAIAGDSAGGGLTVALLLAIRDAGLPQPACGFCISPWVDMEAKGASMATKAAEDPMVQAAGLLDMAAAYLGGTPSNTPLAAPLHADLHGLAPLLIQVGSAETLLDDATRLAAQAGAAQVDVRLEIWPEMIHVWHFFLPILGEARRALAVAGEYIRSRTN